MNGYEDIISLPHPVSRTHPRMSRAERAAQFLPFASLRGFGDLVQDTVRERMPRPKLSDGEIEEINSQLQQLRCLKPGTREVHVRFVREDLESGSVHIEEARGRLMHVDAQRGTVELNGRDAIFFRDILLIEEA